MDVPNFTPSASLVQTISSKISDKSVNALNQISAADPNFTAANAKDAMKAISSGAITGLNAWAQGKNINQSDLTAMFTEASKGVVSGLANLNAPWAAQITPSGISGELSTANQSAFNSLGLSSTLATTIKQATDSVAGSVAVPTYDANTMKAKCEQYGGTWDASRNFCAMPTFSTSLQPPKI